MQPTLIYLSGGLSFFTVWVGLRPYSSFFDEVTSRDWGEALPTLAVSIRQTSQAPPQFDAQSPATLAWLSAKQGVPWHSSSDFPLLPSM